MVGKKCAKCGEIKDISGFQLRKDTGKYRGSCIECEKEYFRENHTKNKIKKNELARQWYRDNKDIAKNRIKEWKKNNPERVKKNRLHEYISSSKRYKNDKEYRLNRNESTKRWRNKNQLKVAKYRKKYNSGLIAKISSNLRSRLRMAINYEFKSGSAVRDLGCSIRDFKLYLESLWSPGMSWENYGYYGWHIDHIIPLASFDLTDREQLIKACHYTNLQPLWAKDNLEKGAKIS